MRINSLVIIFFFFAQGCAAIGMTPNKAVHFTNFRRSQNIEAKVTRAVVNFYTTNQATIDLAITNQGTSPIQTNRYTDYIYITTVSGHKFKIEVSKAESLEYPGKVINPGASLLVHIPVLDRDTVLTLKASEIENMEWHFGLTNQTFVFFDPVTKS